MADDPVTASSEAMKEVARTAGKGIDAVSGLGRFFERIFGPALEELGGALSDQARSWRMSRLLRLQLHYDDARKALGDNLPAKPVEPKFAFALLEAASLEDDDDLQNLFAKLLANASTVATGIEDRKAFVSILQELKPLDAKLLMMIYSAPQNRIGNGVSAIVYTGNLPNEYIVDAKKFREDMRKPSQKTELALWNLARLGCIQPAAAIGGTYTMSAVFLTELGRALVEACTINRNWGGPRI